MTEQAPEVAPEANDPADSDPFDAERAQAKIKKANDEARNLRARLKELEPLAQEAERQREASKTEAQRLSDRAAAAESELLKVRGEAMRTRVALTKGMAADLADRLRGDTEDELSEDADRLLALLKPSGPALFGDADQGPRPTSPSADGAERHIARRLFGGTT